MLSEMVTAAVVLSVLSVMVTITAGIAAWTRSLDLLIISTAVLVGAVFYFVVGVVAADAQIIAIPLSLVVGWLFQAATRPMPL